MFSTTPPPRQTQSYLRNLFARRGIEPKYRFGQNFLIDLNIHDLIVRTAEVEPGDLILEIGPGAGALTTLMAVTGATVIAADIDPDMVALTSDATRGMPNVRVVQGDALRGKNRLNPVLVDQVRSGLAALPGRPFKLVANLPYNAATPIIANLLVHPDLRPRRIVATIQQELAERMLAPPDTDAYGALSVLIQAVADAQIVRTLGPGLFWPRPKVSSAVVRLIPDPVKIAAIGDLAWFQTVVRQVFLHRRKNLRRVLHSLWRDRWTDRAQVDALLERLDLGGQVRAEALTVAQQIALAAALRDELGAVPPAGVDQPEASQSSSPADDEDEDRDEDEADEDDSSEAEPEDESSPDHEVPDTHL